MSEHVRVERRGAVEVILLERPEKKNAITHAMYEAMTEALLAAEEDAEVRALLLTGTGGCFTAGNDLEDFLQSPPTDESSPVLRFLATVSRAAKPLVAAVLGPAVGIGTTVLLHCDLVVAGESARFRLPFVNLGLLPEAASSLLLPLTMSHQRASELLLLGEPFDAHTARELQLVNRVVPDDKALTAAEEMARKVAAQPESSVRMTKQLLKRTRSDAVARRIRDESTLFLQRLASPEARLAMKAFFERRS